MIRKLIEELPSLWEQGKHNEGSHLEHALNCTTLVGNLQLVGWGKKIEDNNNLNLLIFMFASYVSSKLGERLRRRLRREVRIISAISARTGLFRQKTNRLQIATWAIPWFTAHSDELMLSGEGKEDRVKNAGSVLAIIKRANRRTLCLVHKYARTHRHSKSTYPSTM